MVRRPSRGVKGRRAGYAWGDRIPPRPTLSDMSERPVGRESEPGPSGRRKRTSDASEPERPAAKQQEREIMPFGPVDPGLDLPALEERALARWREREVVEEVARLRKGAEPWIFYEGPPTANGRPGLHHVWARAFKDLFPRFQTMRGRDVSRKGGWDCHGLPVELEVEKELGLATKADIEAYGIEAFNQRCRESVQRYVEDWSAAHAALGRMDRHRRRLLDAGQRLHRVGLVDHPPALGQGPALRGPPGHALLRALRHRAQLARGRPGLRGRRRSVDLRSIPPHRGGRRRGRARRRPAGVDHHAVDPHLQRGGGGGSRVQLRAHRRPGRRARPGAGRAGRGTAVPRGRGAGPVARHRPGGLALPAPATSSTRPPAPRQRRTTLPGPRGPPAERARAGSKSPSRDGGSSSPTT